MEKVYNNEDDDVAHDNVGRIIVQSRFLRFSITLAEGNYEMLIQLIAAGKGQTSPLQVSFASQREIKQTGEIQFRIP